MGTMMVAMNSKPLFTWTGDTEEINHIDAAMRKAAKHAASEDVASPEEFAQAVVAHLPQTGFNPFSRAGTLREFIHHPSAERQEQHVRDISLLSGPA